LPTVTTSWLRSSGVDGIPLVTALAVATLLNRLVSGAVGAGVLTIIHQLAQGVRSDAPRMDVVGMEVLGTSLTLAGAQVPDDARLYNMTLAGDLLSNTLFYAAVPAKNARTTFLRAAVLGVSAGVGALTLPRYLVNNDPPHSHHVANNVMTVAWYLAGALAAAATYQALRRD
jgi:hypothetical protein